MRRGGGVGRGLGVGVALGVAVEIAVVVVPCAGVVTAQSKQAAIANIVARHCTRGQKVDCVSGNSKSG